MSVSREHVIIESLEGALRAKETLGDREFVYWSTSPAVLAKLGDEGKTVRSPEAELDQGAFDAIADLSARLSGIICNKARASYNWPGWVDVEKLFDLQISRCLFVSLYKGMLIECVLKAAGTDKVYCVGDIERSFITGGGLVYGRVETLLAQLASQDAFSRIEVIEQKVSEQQKRSTERLVYQGPSSIAEKLLSLLTNTPSSIAYKTWRKILSGRRGGFSGICLTPFPRKRFHVLKDCELIEEAFLPLLLRGASIHRAPQPPTFRDLKVVERDDDVEWVRDVLAAHDLDVEPGDSKLAWGAGLNAGLAHAAPRIRSLLAHVFGELGRWEREASESYEALRAGDEILTSSLNATSQRLFAFYCRQKGIRINTVDHGVTLGLSKWSLFHASYSGMGLGDRGFYHDRKASELMSNIWRSHQAYAVGLPKQQTSSGCRYLKRLISRETLNLDKKENVILITGDITRNNFIYGPYSENDYQFIEKTKYIVKRISSDFPDSTIIFKTYPSERYLDKIDFDDLFRGYRNLRVLEGHEFRFFRHAADFIFTTSMQSTLGWVSGTGVPFLYIDCKWSPTTIKCMKFELVRDPFEADACIISPNQVCQDPSSNFVKKLLENDREN